jgi:hypothetical protein
MARDRRCGHFFPLPVGFPAHLFSSLMDSIALAATAASTVRGNTVGGTLRGQASGYGIVLPGATLAHDGVEAEIREKKP